MIFTLFYMYSTLVQWWRLGNLRNKLRGTLNASNTLLVCCPGSGETDRKRTLENLLYHHDDKFICVVNPKQKINLSSWAVFPKHDYQFPIQFNMFGVKRNLEKSESKLFFLITTQFEKYLPHQAEIIEIERFGELISWKIENPYMNFIIKSDIENLTRLVNIIIFNNDVDINHELKIVKIETVDTEGAPFKIKVNKIFPKEIRLRYSVDENSWKKFITEIKEIYLRNLNINPKITIIDNASKITKLPISEVKPIKKEPKSSSSKMSDKDTLEVSKNKHRHRTSAKTKNLESSDVLKKSEKPKKKTPVLKKMNSLHEDENIEVLESDVKFPSAKEMTRANSTTKRNTKPPNVLIYGDSTMSKENVKNVLTEILDLERYTIYDLPSDKPSELWNDSTTLIIICGNVTPFLTRELLRYLIKGGKLLCLCSDLLHSVLPTFSTAEVREHELVRFSYSKWNRIEMMHHIFCYQPSPAKKQFSRDSDHSSQSDGDVAVSTPSIPRPPSVVELPDEEFGRTRLRVRVLGTEETWQTPSLLSATVLSSKEEDGVGKAIFSQVHLEIDPTSYQEDERKYKVLEESNSVRLAILRHLLEEELEVACRGEDVNKKGAEVYGSGYFLGRHNAKIDLIKSMANLSERNRLVGPTVTLVFCGRDDDPGGASETRLPILTVACPSDFSTVDYYETLGTRDLGRLVVYAPTLASSQRVLECGRLAHGIAVVARRQTAGVGRSGNSWLSPIGCAMFSIQLHVNLKSVLGRHLSLVQHIVIVAIVAAIRNQKGYENLEIGIKWPNDLYAYSKIKIGGLVVATEISSDLAICNVGCGVNLDNSEPTSCLNDVISNFNKDFNLNLSKIQYEKYFALVFNELERILQSIEENGNFKEFFELYYKFWLHKDSEILVQKESGELEKVKIVGIDDFGFLKVKSTIHANLEFSVRPDGNSFDMLKGLVAPKK